MYRFFCSITLVFLACLLLPACSRKPENLTCTISIESDEAEILPATGVKFADGATVLDILQKATRMNKIQMESSGTALAAYVKGIDNLYEFDKGPESGWIFYVNGKQAGESCGSVRVGDGDAIDWTYVLETPPMERQ